jgi:serine/threonine-protein kinase ULK2
VKCYDIIRTQRHLYFVLEFCPHGDLSTYIDEIKTVSEEKAIDMMQQIISGYRYLIENGVLHRDLKPANIMRNGRNLKIADFGFAVKGKKTLLDNISVGTPLYMPP